MEEIGVHTEVRSRSWGSCHQSMGSACTHERAAVVDTNVERGCTGRKVLETGYGIGAAVVVERGCMMEEEEVRRQLET